MARKRMVATVMLALVGAGGLAFAADGGNPILKLVEAVQQVNENTLAIGDQARVIEKQTTAVVQQNAAIANETAAIAKTSAQLDQKLDTVLNAIAKIEIPPPAPSPASASPAHAVWLAPYVDEGPTLHGYNYGTASVMNAGALPATYTCSYFDRYGAVVAHGRARTIGSGHVEGCSPIPYGREPEVEWLLIVSDNPVIATGTNSRTRDSVFITSENMPFRPIDCAGDQIGIEFVCEAVAAIQQKK